jgi:hypothetical protein
MVKYDVFFEVRTEFLNIILTSFCFKVLTTHEEDKVCILWDFRHETLSISLSLLQASSKESPFISNPKHNLCLQCYYNV